MLKLNRGFMQAAAAFLAILVAIFVVPAANAGSGGCAALIAAAKKGFRGDPAALQACKGAVAGGEHAATVKPRALQHQEAINDTRQLKGFKHRNHNDPNIRAQMRGVTALRRADRQVRDEDWRQTKRLIEDALGAMGNSGPRHGHGHQKFVPGFF